MLGIPYVVTGRGGTQADSQQRGARAPCALGVLPAAYLVVQVFELPRQALWQVVAAGNLAGALAYAAYYARGRFLRKTL